MPVRGSPKDALTEIKEPANTLLGSATIWKLSLFRNQKRSCSIVGVTEGELALGKQRDEKTAVDPRYRYGIQTVEGCCVVWEKKNRGGQPSDPVTIVRTTCARSRIRRRDSESRREK